jgi:plasmid replication initiation protein
MVATKKVLSKATPLITKSNKLVEACYRLDLVELRIIMAAIHIGRVNDCLVSGPERDLCKPIQIKASLFTEHFPMGERVVYEQIRKGVKSLLRKPLSAIEPINGRECPVDIPWFSRAVYLKHEAAIEVEFNHHVLPYIARVNSEFTEYRLEKIGRLSSAHAVRIYELLSQYLSIGKRDVEVDWLKSTLMIEHEYPVIADLRKRVIDPSVRQINDLTDLQVSYVQKKKGHKIVSFLFSIEMKADHMPKPKLPAISDAYIAEHARPGENVVEAGSRLRAERAAMKKSAAAAQKEPVPLDLPESITAPVPQNRDHPAVKRARQEALDASRKGKLLVAARPFASDQVMRDQLEKLGQKRLLPGSDSEKP